LGTSWHTWVRVVLSTTGVEYELTRPESTFDTEHNGPLQNVMDQCRGIEDDSLVLSRAMIPGVRGELLRNLVF